MNKKINPYVSRKLKTLSFVLMVMIVVLHSNMHSLSTGVNYYLQQFITNGITRTAVPLFFMISGFLFFGNTDRYDRYFFARKIERRTKTILLPFLFWSFVGFAFMLTLQSIAPIRPFFSGKMMIDQMSFLQILKSLFWEPIGTYQLWFLKDLFIIILLSPVIYLILYKTRFFPIIILIAYWISGHNLWLIQSESLTFFTIGAYLAIAGSDLPGRKASCPTVIFFLLCWLVFSLIFTFASKNHIVYYVNILFGIGAIWTAYDYLNLRANNDFANRVIPFSFFIFLLHEPLLTVIKKLLLLSWGNSEISIFIIYLLAPILTLSICISFGILIKKHWPRSYSFLTGAR